MDSRGVKKIIIFLFSFLCFSGFYYREMAVSQQEDILARINNWTITVEDFYNRLNKIMDNFQAPEKKCIKDAKRELFTALIYVQIYAQESIDRGWDKDKKIIKRLQNYDNSDSKYFYVSSKDNIVKKLQKYINELAIANVGRCEVPFTTTLVLMDYKSCLLTLKLIQELKKNIKLPLAEKEKAYKKYIDLSSDYRQLYVEEIVTSNEEVAREIYVKLKKGENLSSLLDYYPKGVIKNKGTEVELVYDPRIMFFPYKPEKFQEYWEKVCALKEGQVSEVFKDKENNYYILKLRKEVKLTLLTFKRFEDEFKDQMIESKLKAKLIEISLERMRRFKFDNYIDKLFKMK